MGEREQGGCGSLLVFIFAIVNVAIGASYKDDCKFAVPTYLMAAGGITITFTLLWAIAMCTPCECDDRIMMALSPLVVLAQFCIVIWGSVLVFGWYGYWTYDTTDKANEGYCGYTPFMYSFVMLILGWVTIPFLLCCLCSFFIAFIMAR